jgi:hypothetical protein
MSTKTSTAALDSIVSQRFFYRQRRAPRRPACAAQKTLRERATAPFAQRLKATRARYSFTCGYFGRGGNGL